MNERPLYSKWKRRRGGYKVCPKRDCRHRHPPAMRIDGRTVRPKSCIKCGANLPDRLTYPKKGAVAWYAREFNPATGRTRDFACDSSEAADELIAQRKRDWTPHAVQASVVEYASTLARQIDATDRETAINELIRKLGGDATARMLKPMAWPEAVDQICGDLDRNEKRSTSYVEEVRRVCADLTLVTGLVECADLDTDHVRAYRQALQDGGWTRNGKTVSPVADRTVKKCLATLRALVGRAVARKWVLPAVLQDAPDVWLQGVEEVSNEYMPDSDFRDLLAAAGSRWWWTFLLVAYNTAARRGDLLRLRWTDVDLQGTKGLHYGVNYPHVLIANTKSNRSKKRPLVIPLYRDTVAAIERLRDNPMMICPDRYPASLRDASDCPEVFPVRGFAGPGPTVSNRFAALCVQAGLTETVQQGGKAVANRWHLHSIRFKANMDIQRGGGSIRDQMALTGHKSARVNIEHYQVADPARMRTMIDNLSGFQATDGLRMPA